MNDSFDQYESTGNTQEFHFLDFSVLKIWKLLKRLLNHHDNGDGVYLILTSPGAV